MNGVSNMPCSTPFLPAGILPAGGGGHAGAAVPQDVTDRQPDDEAERLVAYCEAPGLLWQGEPFGMIA